ncbi:hypothetical protein NLM27_13070 [Bradyrhizobium sp. CCGB12]|uniref:hypothetical protein n=1 Tax=Bradyrhizobium sp. CCGB12 TaxID=2949632 RepID=UPI0020B1AF85|nr:hypothetical protein [Bradyrhizobium sp. CCGB12]MCP3389705.1 hypothetical protein [Bradyrhizobium sp. CCGB12]
MKAGANFSRMRALFENASFPGRGDFEPTRILKLIDWQGDHNGFAMPMSAPGAAREDVCPDHEDAGPATAEGGQRQRDDLAIRAVSIRLVRHELMGQI